EFAQADTELDEVLSVVQRGVILNLVTVERVPNGALIAAAAGEGTLNGNGRSQSVRGLVVNVTDELKAGLVDEVGTNDLRIADLQSVLRLVLAITVFRQTEGTYTFVVVSIAEILIAGRQRIARRELKIEAGTHVEAAARIGHPVAERNNGKSRGI